MRIFFVRLSSRLVCISCCKKCKFWFRRKNWNGVMIVHMHYSSLSPTYLFTISENSVTVFLITWFLAWTLNNLGIYLKLTSVAHEVIRLTTFFLIFFTSLSRCPRVSITVHLKCFTCNTNECKPRCGLMDLQLKFLYFEY